MNDAFKQHLGNLLCNYEALMAAPVLPIRERSRFKDRAGIYLLIFEGKYDYVGRTRNLRQRLQSHLTANPNAASYALKRVRRAHQLEASYKPNMSREFITREEPWRGYFLEEIENIRRMDFQFLDLPDKVDQYLLELYATMELGLELSGFDTH